MVVQGALDFNILLGCDYIYVMITIISSLFHVVGFPHDGRIVTIDKLSFFSHQVPPSSPSSSVSSCLLVVPSPPQVNYVATCSASMDDHVDDLVHHVLGALGPDLFLVPDDMYSSPIIILPSSADLLGSMSLFGP